MSNSSTPYGVLYDANSVFVESPATRNSPPRSRSGSYSQPRSRSASVQRSNPSPLSWCAWLHDRRMSLYVAFFSILFLATTAAVPTYNKWLMGKHEKGKTTEQNPKKFPYPLTVTLLELSGVVVVLLLVNVLKHYCYDGGRARRHHESMRDLLSQDMLGSGVYDEDDGVERHPSLVDPHGHPSWFFGPGFLWKAKELCVVGVVFGVKLGVTNWALKLVSTNTHVLIQSSAIVFVVAFSWLLVSERPSLVTICCCLVSVGGIVMVTLDFDEKWHSPILALCLNFATPALEGLTVVYLRKSGKVLKPTEMRDPVLSEIGVMEMTLFKLMWSALTVLPFALAFEGFFHDTFKHEVSVFTAMNDVDKVFYTRVVGGALITLALQVSVFGVAIVSSAISVGVLGQLKVVGQVGLASLVYNDFAYTTMHVIGMIMIICASVVYGVAKYARRKAMLEEAERAHAQAQAAL